MGLHKGGMVEICVTISLLGSLRLQAGRCELQLRLPPASSVADAIRAAGLPDRVDIWALLDGERVEREKPLFDGARLTLFQPVGGG